MKSRILTFLILLLSGTTVAVAAHSVADIPNVHLADRTRYVSNPDGVLSAAAEARINASLADIWQKTSAEVVVVAVDDIDSDDIDGFATQLFEKWGIGKSDKDNGLLVLIARDWRRAVFRTGYGMEGTLPDVICGRILRDVMAPFYREGDYDGGTIAAVERINEIVTTPGATEELMSKYENDRRSDDDDVDFFTFFLYVAIGIALVSVVSVFYLLFTTRRLDEQERYRRLDEVKTPLLFLTFLGLGMPLVGYLPLVLTMKRIRNHRRDCPQCGTRMIKLDEDRDNAYLSPEQDLEERINSIDYDVWLCPECNDTEIIPYVNKQSSYTVCPECGARACTLLGNHTVTPPTVGRAGRGVRTYGCRNCNHRSQVFYDIPKLVAPIIVGGIGGRGGGFGGGGFSGGSFGGGMTGGGGASGGW